MVHFPVQVRDASASPEFSRRSHDDHHPQQHQHQHPSHLEHQHHPHHLHQHDGDAVDDGFDEAAEEEDGFFDEGGGWGSDEFTDDELDEDFQPEVEQDKFKR